MPDNVLIAMHGVTKRFETPEVTTYALQGVDLEIAAGEFVLVTGPSGCGKTTLLSVLGLIEPPNEGSYTLAGQSVAALTERERAVRRNHAMGFVFQSFNLVNDLSVFENVELPLVYRGLTSADRRQRVLNALERVGMSHRMFHFPVQLSGGQQQRVAVARAVAGDPQIVLADEPTGNLDSTNGEAVMALLRDLHREGATVCMVTHDPRYTTFAERTVALADGKVLG